MALTDSLDQVLVEQGPGKKELCPGAGIATGKRDIHLVYWISEASIISHIPNPFLPQTSGVQEDTQKDQAILRFIGIRVGLLMILGGLGGW